MRGKPPHVGGDPYTLTLAPWAQWPPICEKVNGNPNMKRASSRLGSQALTLSLLSSMVLLAACGGGGKDTPAAAAPAQVPSGPVETPKVPDPTISDLTAADEPYIVAVSSIEHDQSVDPIAPAYQINILDGKTQSVVYKISFDTPLAQKWLTVNKVERAFKELPDPDTAGATLPGKFLVETDKGPAHLYFIQAGTVQHIDLSRRTEAKPSITSNQVSSLTDACSLVDSYALNQTGSASALTLVTAGPDKDCNKTADNVRVVISSDDDASTAPRTQFAPTAKLLKRIYNAGILSGVLVQEAVPDTVKSKLTMLSPLQDKALLSPVELPTGDTVTPFFSSFPSTTPLGAEWLADSPGKDTGEGYLRLQGPTKSQLFKLIWDNAKQAFAITLEQSFSTPTPVASVKSLNDGAYTYFSVNNIAYRGPVAGSKPFELIYNLGNVALESKTTGLTPRYQTKTHVVYTQGEPATSGWAVPKTPGSVYKVFQSAPQLGAPIQVIGQRGNTLVVLGKDSFDNLGMGVATLNIQAPVGDNLTFAQVHNIQLTAPVWSATRINGQLGVDTLVVQAAGGGAYNTVDLSAMKFGISLGEVDSDLADSTKVVASQHGLSTMNQAFDVTMELFGKIVTRRDPWLFNLGVKDSLKKIDTWAEEAAQ